MFRVASQDFSPTRARPAIRWPSRSARACAGDRLRRLAIGPAPDRVPGPAAAGSLLPLPCLPHCRSTSRGYPNGPDTGPDALPDSIPAPATPGGILPHPDHLGHGRLASGPLPRHGGHRGRPPCSRCGVAPGLISRRSRGWDHAASQFPAPGLLPRLRNSDRKRAGPAGLSGLRQAGTSPQAGPGSKGCRQDAGATTWTARQRWPGEEGLGHDASDLAADRPALQRAACYVPGHIPDGDEATP